MLKIKVGIIGAAGYTGGELLRLLQIHPNIELSYAHSSSNAGSPIGSVHEDLGHSGLLFSKEYHFDIDALFLCAGHGKAKEFLSTHIVPESVTVIDLSHDFRLKEASVLGNRSFVYGLPELNKSAIASAKSIANPGCFATAIQLGLLPLAEGEILNEVHTTGITGSTGAGQSLSPTSHFSWRNNNIQAYKTLSHQHLGEINESIQQVQGRKAKVHFIPWRGDFTRGIYISSQIQTEWSLIKLVELFRDYFVNHPFVHISESPIHLKQVVNTNFAYLYLEKVEDQLVVHSVIDNLVKGASGQALHNMNIAFGLDETTGLNLKASYF